MKPGAVLAEAEESFWNLIRILHDSRMKPALLKRNSVKGDNLGKSNGGGAIQDFFIENWVSPKAS